MNNTPPLYPQQLTVLQALELANAHWNAGQAAPAEQLCRQVLQVAPLQPDALNLLGLMMYAYGKTELALDYIRKASQSPEAPATVFSNLAELCRQQGLLQDAEQAARRATEQEPELVAAWNNLGIILQETGNFSASLECLLYVASQQPDNAEVYNNLANTYKHLGDLPRAQESYQRALTLRPDYAEVHSNLAVLLHSQGCVDEAAASARRAIDINPHLADAYLNLADIELSRRHYTDALHWVNVLLEFSPQHVGALTALAQIMIVHEQYEEAITVARKTLTVAPHHANAHQILGNALQALGLYEDAERAYCQAASLPGTTAEEALIARAVLLMEIGDNERATEGFEQALKRFPDSLRIIAARSDNKVYCAGDPDIMVMEKALLNPPAPPLPVKMRLHFSLGKAYLDIGDSGRAFFHLNQGNAFKRSSFSYDAAQSSSLMNKIAAVFTPALMQRFHSAGTATDRLVFVVGMPCSGTTLIEQLLTSYPDVYSAGKLRTLHRTVARHGRFPDDVLHWEHTDFARIGADYLEQMSQLAPNALRVIDNLPGNFLYAGLIPLLLPGARIIHCRRDPVDTCLSCYSKLFSSEMLFAYQLDELGSFYLAYQQLMAHFRQLLPPQCFIEVDYEAVVGDPEGQAQRLVEFIDLPSNNTGLHIQETGRIVHTARRQPIYTSSRGRWQQHMAQLGPLLDVLGMEQK